MKKLLQHKFITVFVIFITLTTIINFFSESYFVRTEYQKSSEYIFSQIGKTLIINQQNIDASRTDFKASCINKASAAQEFINQYPINIDDPEEMRRLARIIQVDELHLFNSDGDIIAGSEPKYFGLNFNSGSQMRFFLPMLNDKNLKLCQDITPNTAEGKHMQYAAVWCLEKPYIVQIGMEPKHIVKALQQNSLSYIFSHFTAEKEIFYLAFDASKNKIIASTFPSLIYDNYYEQLISTHIEENDNESSLEQGMAMNINGRNYYVFFDDEKILDDIILGRMVNEEKLYYDVIRNVLLTTMYMILASIIVLLALSLYIDRYVIRDIKTLNTKLEQITAGDWDTRVNVATTPELAQLSNKINIMVKSLATATSNFFAICDIAKLNIGLYNYRPGNNNVVTTNNLQKILGFETAYYQKLIENKELFAEELQRIQQNPIDVAKGVYKIPETGHMVHLEQLNKDDMIIGFIIDITADYMEQQEIRHERDIDMLTNLYNRRKLYNELELLFQKHQELGVAGMYFIDANNLKNINDTYGHHVGDEYLLKVAETLKTCSAPKKLLARFGGDEFVLFIYGCESKQEIQHYYQELQQTMRQTYLLVNNEKCSVQFTTGAAFYPNDGINYHELLKIADNDMYIHKQNYRK